MQKDNTRTKLGTTVGRAWHYSWIHL